VEDYKQYIYQIPPQSQIQESNEFSFSEFTLGAAKGLPRGVWDSGKGLFVFLADCGKHPIQTSKQMVDAITTLVELVRTDQWGVVAESLSPEAHQLVTQWDTLSSEKKGELTGYVVGKHGADILAPGAIVKVARKCAKTGQELTLICKNLQIAQETLILETVAEIGSSAKITEIIESGQKISFIGEELGFTASEIGELKQAGNLEATIVKQCEHLSPALQESFALYKNAQNALKQYAKKPMPEFKVRELIHETGIPTFPRPKGIPENFLVMITEKSAGMEYVHPTNTYIRVRVMPGKPHSPFPHQQKPYVIQKTDRGALDKTGKYVLTDAPEAHIPFAEFIYRDHINVH
jgi:hypothetical protein